MLYLYVWVIGSKIIGTWSDCSVVINELNIDTINEGGNPYETAEFIELKAIGFCDADRPILQKYRLLVIEGLGHRGFPEIELYVNLQSSKFPKSNFFVIGSTNVINVGLTFKSDYVQTRRKIMGPGKQTTLTSYFSAAATNIEANSLHNGNKRPVVALLLYSYDPKNFPKFDLNKRTGVLEITEPLEKEIKKYLIDMVVWAKCAATDRCDIFERLVPSFGNKPYVLREMDSEGYPDRSLNICPHNSEEEKRNFPRNYLMLGRQLQGSKMTVMVQYFSWKII